MELIVKQKELNILQEIEIMNFFRYMENFFDFEIFEEGVVCIRIFLVDFDACIIVQVEMECLRIFWDD